MLSQLHLRLRRQTLHSEAVEEAEEGEDEAVAVVEEGVTVLSKTEVMSNAKTTTIEVEGRFAEQHMQMDPARNPYLRVLLQYRPQSQQSMAKRQRVKLAKRLQRAQMRVKRRSASFAPVR